jgi:ring-1,2-phenylacetyl-CoA epoxidase subunit PaaC
MTPELKYALTEQLLALADDELILGHRNSEWCGHAPILEEDIAFANIALDEIGHALMWYQLLADLLDEDRDTYPDKMVYRRAANEFRSAQFVELPKGDWAFSMLRQYLFDAAEQVRLAHLVHNYYKPLSGAAEKIRKEEIYHLRHTQAWVKRLGLGTEESNRRMQTALNQLWSYAQQLFMASPAEVVLVRENFGVYASAIREEWEANVIPFLTDSGLTMPKQFESPAFSRRQHTEHLTGLVGKLQEVAHQFPDARW